MGAGLTGVGDQAYDAHAEERVFVEPRWPIALALGFFIAISIALQIIEPHRQSLGQHWLVPGVEIALLAALLAAAALVATAVLITELVQGGKVTDSASSLLMSGALARDLPRIRAVVLAGDVMPMARWAKLTMALQSLISLTVVGLVSARGVNVFSQC